MEPYLNFGIFSKIKDLNLFSKVRGSFDTIEWGNGIDLDPQFVYEKCVKEKHLSRVAAPLHFYLSEAQIT